MSVYYNDIDPFAAAWLRELIREGHLPDGTVDERSIVEVVPSDLGPFRQCHFFAGIGGWPYALALARWPQDREAWTASLPCQPLSVAGKRHGALDGRHLWPAFYRLLSVCRPAIVFGEQVASIDGREWLAGVRLDLEALGYACGAANLPACGVAAPHRRERLYWGAVADAQHRPCGDAGKLEQAEGDRVREISRQGAGQRLAGTPGAASGVADADVSEQGRRQQRLHPEDRGRGGAAAIGQRPDGVEFADGAGPPHDRQGDARSGIAGEGPADHRTAGSPGGLVRLGELKRTGLERHPGYGADRRQSRRLDADPGRPVAETGGGLVNATVDGWGEGRPEHELRRGRDAASGASFWDGAEWRVGADGKARRVKPGVRLLAHGVPNRVGLLRGFGNAIVPQAAAEFIRAVSDGTAQP